MDYTEPPRIEITQEKSGEFSAKLGGETPIIVGDNNIIFPNHWTVEQCNAWIRKYKPDHILFEEDGR